MKVTRTAQYVMDTPTALAFQYESDIHEYEELLEREYINSLFHHLSAEMGRSFEEVQFVVWSHLGPDGMPKAITRDNGRRKVVLYLSDESGSVPYQLTKHASAVFKCYLPREFPEQQIFAMPLGYVAGLPESDPIGMDRRRHNVFFSGCVQKNRLAMASTLYQLATGHVSLTDGEALGEFHRTGDVDLSRAFPNSYIHFTSKFGSGLNGIEYAATLEQSKIALCPPGWKSNETFRHFEAMRAGCVVVSSPLPATRLYRGAPFVILDSWAELGNTVGALLKDLPRLRLLQEQTVAWWESVCSERATARFITSQLT